MQKKKEAIFPKKVLRTFKQNVNKHWKKKIKIIKDHLSSN